MRPLTDDKPKAMIPILGTPFLEYQIDQLRDQGFEKVLILLGYLPDVVKSHFRDGRRWGVRIEYAVTAPEQLTSSRVAAARKMIDPCFLLLYCDNYWPMRMEALWSRFCQAGKPGLITVYSNKDGYSRGSVILDENGHVKNFDRLRTLPNLREVEISYAILTDLALDLLPIQDTLFEEAIYTPLAQQGRLTSFATDHRYYSIGSPHRIAATEAFMRRRQTVILDRDGVLNRKPETAQYVRSWDEWAWCAGALEALRLLHESGMRVIVATNQPGVARGFMSKAELEYIHKRMAEEAAENGGAIDAVYCCTHGWNDNCDCRKPKPGLLYRAQRDLHLDLTRTPFIGDQDKDAEAAAQCGCPFYRVTEAQSLLSVARDLVERKGI